MDTRFFRLGFLSLIGCLTLGARSEAPFFYLRHTPDSGIFGPYVLADHQTVLGGRYRIRTGPENRFRIVENRSGDPVTAPDLTFHHDFSFSLEGQKFRIIAGEAYEDLQSRRKKENQLRREKLLNRAALDWALEQALDVELTFDDPTRMVLAFNTRIRILEKALGQYPEGDPRDELEQMLARTRHRKETSIQQASMGKIRFREQWMMPAEKELIVLSEALYPEYGLFIKRDDRESARDLAREIQRTRRKNPENWENREAIVNELRAVLRAAGEDPDSLEGREIASVSYRYDRDREVHLVLIRMKEAE